MLDPEPAPHLAFRMPFCSFCLRLARPPAELSFWPRLLSAMPPPLTRPSAGLRRSRVARSGVSLMIGNRLWESLSRSKSAQSRHRLSALYQPHVGIPTLCLAGVMVCHLRLAYYAKI